jgi:hypothetical protein
MFASPKTTSSVKNSLENVHLTMSPIAMVELLFVLRGTTLSKEEASSWMYTVTAPRESTDFISPE